MINAFFLGLNIISILEFLGEEKFGEYFLCVLNEGGFLGHSK